MCEFSSPSSSSESSESDSCSCCICVKYFFIFLESLVSFVTLFSWLDQDELNASSSSFSDSGKLVDGCPLLFQLKHYLSLQYYLSKGLLPILPLLPPPLPPLWPLPPCTNAIPLDCVVFCTTFLLYLSRRCRVFWQFFGYPL